MKTRHDVHALRAPGSTMLGRVTGHDGRARHYGQGTQRDGR